MTRAMDVFKTDQLLDHVALIEKVKYMLRVADRMFRAEPDPVYNLRQAYELVDAHRDAYLEAVIGEQRDVVNQVLDERRAEARLRKDISRLEHSIKRKIKRWDQLKKWLETAGPEKFDDAVYGSVNPEGRKKKINRLYARNKKQFYELAKEILDAKDDLDALRDELRIVVAVNGIRERVEGQLKGLGLLEEDKPKEVVTVKYARSNELDKYISSGFSGGRKYDSNDSGTDLDPEIKDSLLDIGINQIKEAIGIAASTGKIRVLLPESVARQKYERDWIELIRKLGYQGQIEPVRYQQIASDEVTPVIVPSKMNVHEEIGWKRSKKTPFFVIRDHPKILNNYLG